MAADDLVGGPPDGPQRDTRVRRRWSGAVLACAAVVVTVVAFPHLSLHAESPPDRPPATPAAQLLAERLDNANFHWRLRGNLADDDAFVAAASRRLPHRASGWRPLFAGQLPDGSRLLLAGSRLDPAVVGTSVAAVHLPGSPGTGWSVSNVAALTDPSQVLGWAAATTGSDGTVFAVALGPPRPLRLQMSSHVDFSTTGYPSRTWQTLTSQDGAVVADFGRRTDPAIAVRSLGPATFVTPVLVPVSGRAPSPPEAVVVRGVDQPGYRGPASLGLRQGLVVETTDLLDLGASTQRVIWSGVPWGGRHFALVLIRRPDGVRFQALVGEQAGGWFPAGVRALPQHAPDELPWLLEPFTPGDPTLLLCPTGRGHLVYRHGSRRTRLPIRENGVAALVEPGASPPKANGARVTVFGSGGRRLLTTTLPRTGFDDPLALDRR